MIQIFPVEGVGEMRKGDDLAGALAGAIRGSGIELLDGDVVAVTSKAVSKSEGRVANLPDEGPRAHAFLVESEAAEILRRRGDLVIARTRHGFVCANAGIDRSNAAPDQAILLPEDPDRSARRLQARLERDFSVELAVIVTDTFGRAWRRGQTDVAIGVAGMLPILDLRGTPDAGGRLLDVTEIAVADELAAAAELAMGKARGIPAAVIRGVEYRRGRGEAVDMVRPPHEDLFL